MKVLIVVDMQNDFVDGVLGSKEAVSMIDTAVETINSFDGKVFYTQDTHGEDYLDTEEGRHLPVVHCIKGSQGWKIHPKIEKALLLKDATGIEKSTFGSSHALVILKPLQQHAKITRVNSYLRHVVNIRLIYYLQR